MPDERGAVIRALPVEEAMLFPLGEGSEAGWTRFRLAPRLLSHVRHQQKYLDMPVPERDVFVFLERGIPTGERARTLREFEAIVSNGSHEVLDGHLRRSDFSRWIADVYRDRPLARELRELENQYQLGRVLDIEDALVQLIEDRYAAQEGLDGQLVGAAEDHARPC